MGHYGGDHDIMLKPYFLASKLHTSNNNTTYSFQTSFLRLYLPLWLRPFGRSSRPAVIRLVEAAARPHVKAVNKSPGKIPPKQKLMSAV